MELFKFSTTQPALKSIIETVYSLEEVPNKSLAISPFRFFICLAIQLNLGGSFKTAKALINNAINMDTYPINFINSLSNILHIKNDIVVKYFSISSYIVANKDRYIFTNLCKSLKDSVPESFITDMLILQEFVQDKDLLKQLLWEKMASESELNAQQYFFDTGTYRELTFFLYMRSSIDELLAKKVIQIETKLDPILVPSKNEIYITSKNDIYTALQDTVEAALSENYICSTPIIIPPFILKN